MISICKQLQLRDMLRLKLKNELESYNHNFYIHNCYIEKDKCIIVELEFPSFFDDLFDLLYDYSDSFQLSKFENGSCLYLLKFNFDDNL